MLKESSEELLSVMTREQIGKFLQGFFPLICFTRLRATNMSNSAPWLVCTLSVSRCGCDVAAVVLK